jgi:hypothetical protein
VLSTARSPRPTCGPITPATPSECRDLGAQALRSHGLGKAATLTVSERPPELHLMCVPRPSGGYCPGVTAARNETAFEASERPESRASPPSLLARSLIVVGGGCLVVYGVLSVAAASLWGPGNSDELVSGGAELVPWFGLPIAGTAAAVVALWLVPRPRSATWALLVAALSLAAWTAFVFLVV